MAFEATAPQAKGAFRGEVAILQLVVGLFLLLRLYFDLEADPFGDEAYYWLWGQHLDWSYFDHPPLHAWLLRLVDLVIGWHPISVRVLPWLSLGAVLALFSVWGRRFVPPGDNQLWFWRTAAIYLASPLFFGMTMVAYNDHLLVALSLAALTAFLIYVERIEAGESRATRWLYLAALALGLAVLTKYNGIFVGLGMAATFLLRPRLRARLGSPHPWLAALLAMAIQAPVLVWNLRTGFASFRYHLGDRWSASTLAHPNLSHPLNFLLLSLLVWSPVLIVPLLRLVFSKPLTPAERRARTLALSVLVISTLCLVGISILRDAYFYWNIVAFVGLMPLLTRFMTNRWLLGIHMVFGVLAAGLIVVNFTVVPLGTLVTGRVESGSAINFGWDQVVGHVQAAAAQAPTDIVGATRYSTTSQLGFALGITDAVKLSPEHSQYDYWQAGMPLAGKSALILVDEGDGSPQLAWLRTHFATLEQIDAFAVTRYDRQIYSWRLFRGTDYRDAQ
jgi:4-amino-4-deoxy-L-arabinose transferase-like glycosyltransferase